MDMDMDMDMEHSASNASALRPHCWRMDWVLSLPRGDLRAWPGPVSHVNRFVV